MRQHFNVAQAAVALPVASSTRAPGRPHPAHTPAARRCLLLLGLRHHGSALVQRVALVLVGGLKHGIRRLLARVQNQRHDGGGHDGHHDGAAGRKEARALVTGGGWEVSEERLTRVHTAACDTAAGRGTAADVRQERCIHVKLTTSQAKTAGRQGDGPCDVGYSAVAGHQHAQLACIDVVCRCILYGVESVCSFGPARACCSPADNVFNGCIHIAGSSHQLLPGGHRCNAARCDGRRAKNA